MSSSHEHPWIYRCVGSHCRWNGIMTKPNTHPTDWLGGENLKPTRLVILPINRPSHGYAMVDPYRPPLRLPLHHLSHLGASCGSHGSAACWASQRKTPPCWAPRGTTRSARRLGTTASRCWGHRTAPPGREWISLTARSLPPSRAAWISSSKVFHQFWGRRSNWLADYWFFQLRTLGIACGWGHL